METLRREAMNDALQEELTRLLAPVEKRTRGFLPPPEHLKQQLAVYSPAEHNVPRTAAGKLNDSATAAVTTAAQNESVLEERRRAEAVCLARVPRLESWLSRVDNAIAAADAAEEQVEGIKCRVDTLLQITTQVHKHSDAISANASALMAKKAKLERTLTSVANAMRHFNRVDELLAEVSHPGLSASSSRFPALLDELEDTAVYLSRVHRYKSAATYSTRLSHAYQRAMLCLRDAIVLKVQDVATNLMTGPSYLVLFANRANAPVVMNNSPQAQANASPEAFAEAGLLRPSTLDAALAGVNEDFVNRLSAIDGLLRLLEARCSAAEAEMFVTDVFNAFAEVRSRIVAPLLADYGDGGSTKIATSSSLGAKERAAMGLLMRNLKAALSEERRLFDRLWLSENVPQTAFERIANDIADAAYQQFRSALLRTDELEELCALCSSLIENAHGRSGSGSTQTSFDQSAALNAGLSVVKRMIQDTQERIVFRTSIFIRSKVAPFPYSSDVLWKQCLDAVNSIATFAPHAAIAPAPTEPSPLLPSQPDASVAPTTPTDPTASLAAEASTSSIPAATPLTPNTAAEPSIFVPLERCVELLNLLYPAVERGVFAVFADECVHTAVDALLRAAKMIRQHGELQDNAPSASSIKLAKGGLRSLLYSKLFLVRHLLRLREALTPFDVNLTVVEKGVNLSSLAERKLELVQRSRESKRDVEAELRSACEDSIEAMVKAITAPLTTAVTPAAFPSNASEAQLVDFVENCVLQTRDIAVDIKAQLGCFIAVSATRNVLWKPCKSRLSSSYAALLAKAQERFADFVPSTVTESLFETI